MSIPASSHSYLGEMDDLEGSVDLLEPGSTYQLPLLPLEGCVFCPGDLIPHRLLNASDRMALRQAMNAPAPLTRLIAVSCWGPSFQEGGNIMHLENVGCTAEIVKMSRDQVSIVAKGRQRIRIEVDSSPEPLSFLRIAVTILENAVPPAMPPCASGNMAAWPEWVYRQFDASTLARTARALYSQMLPKATCFVGDPLMLSFWLIANVPFDNYQRQKLLEIDQVSERLTQEIEWLKRMSALHCRHCHRKLADIKDLVALSDEGVGAHYVNSHGIMHDMVTLESAANDSMQIVGEPERDHSWFPGYAWQIAYCRDCRLHLGWLFTALEEGEHGGEGSFREGAGALPQRFFGLRRPPLTNDLAQEQASIPPVMFLDMEFTSASDDESFDGEEESAEEGSEGGAATGESEGE